MHILLEKFKTPYEAIPFDKINDKDYKPAFEKAMEIAENRVKSMIESKESPTFKNFILPLEKATWELDQISSIFFNLCAAETNDYLESLQAEIAPVLSNFTNDLFLNPELFKKVKQVYDQEREQLKDTEDKKLLEENYLFFVRN